MLQNRKIKLLLICVIIAINHSEQGHQGQSQIQVRKNLPPQNLQQQQQHQQPQIRQLDQRIIQERTHKAREMLKFMNLEGDVCKDFYDFACGKWLQEQNTDKAREGDLISVQSEMEQFANKQLQVILNEPIASQEDISVKVVKDFYRSCLRVPATSPAQKKFMQNIVLNHGGLPDIKRIGWQPNYNWIHVIADLRRKYGLDILIGLTIERTNPNHKAIYIEEPRTTLLPVELCSSLAARQIDEKDQVFDRIQNEIKDNLRNIFELTESNALRIAGSILRFEFDLCKYMRIDQMATTPLDETGNEALNTNRRGHPARIVENKMHGVRQSTSNNLRSLRSLSDNYQIDFKDFIERSLDTTTVSQVYFRSEEYFQQLSSIARKGIHASFAHYIMYRALSEISFPLNERNDQRPFNCANQVMHYLPQVLGKLYADKFNHEQSRQDMKDMFSIIKQSFSKYLLRDVNWMADNTKRAINQKVATLKITFPTYPPNGDVLRGLPLHDDQDYWHKLETIMMYNANQTIQQVRLTNDHSNFIEAPAVTIQQKPLAYELVAGYGLLQKPFYSPVYANSLKYSSIGVAMAREIIKIFDYQGLQQNPMNTFPWDPATMESFPLISECFRAQISNYFHNNPNVYRNASKLRDIMVETSALNIAFNAYIHWLELPHRQRSELQMETLPDMNFTNTQLFFINFAQTHCAAHHKAEIVPEFLPLYRRTMEQYDINGPVSNNVEFSRDFSCEVGADMNLDDKCLLY
ncbi:endothelin-converting enzyme homolog [Calliphora vicina]|uniref:endothelin-converting enzyme homolog n=1 Tax=Calliphora vicina TaxID=7373 RepID=UPI00325A5A02